MYKIGDKFMLCKEMGSLMVNQTYEIGGFSKNSDNDEMNYIMRSEETKTAVVSITGEELNTYFQPIKQKMKWSDWHTMNTSYCGIIYFRTNGKKVQVKDTFNKAEACCNKADIFNLHTGLNIALLRLKLKRLRQGDINICKHVLELDGQRKMIKEEINFVDRTLKRFLKDINKEEKDKTND
jgi:hypothetical protein